MRRLAFILIVAASTIARAEDKVEVKAEYFNEPGTVDINDGNGDGHEAKRGFAVPLGHAGRHQVPRLERPFEQFDGNRCPPFGRQPPCTLHLDGWVVHARRGADSPAKGLFAGSGRPEADPIRANAAGIEVYRSYIGRYSPNTRRVHYISAID